MVIDEETSIVAGVFGGLADLNPSLAVVHPILLENSSEIRLMRAVLEDAVECVRKGLVSKSTSALRLAREAEEWIFYDDPQWIFSFPNICAALGIDPDYLRLGIKKWKENPGNVPKKPVCRQAVLNRHSPSSTHFARHARKYG